MKRLLVLLFVVLTFTIAATPPASAQTHLPGTVPLYRYYNSHHLVRDHFYTIEDLGPSIPGGAGSSWVFENIECYVFPTPEDGTVAFLRYWNPNLGDHFYTIDEDELGPGGSQGFTFENIEAYVYPSAQTGTVPLHRYYHYEHADHFYTINFNTLGNGSFDGPTGWIYEGVECFVSP